MILTIHLRESRLIFHVIYLITTFHYSVASVATISATPTRINQITQRKKPEIAGFSGHYGVGRAPKIHRKKSGYKTLSATRMPEGSRSGPGEELERPPRTMNY